MRRVLPCLLLPLAAAACDQRNEARVGDAILPQAMRTTAPPPGTPVAVLPGKPPAAAAGAQLAIDVNVPWTEVKPLLAASPVLLVGDRDRLRAFQLEDTLDPDEPTLKVIATARGKFCVSPPGTDLAYCMESADKKHISAAFVREVMRKAVTEYEITQARLDVEDEILWADIVRTVDGARTCCGKTPVRIAFLQRKAKPVNLDPEKGAIDPDPGAETDGEPAADPATN